MKKFRMGGKLFHEESIVKLPANKADNMVLRGKLELISPVKRLKKVKSKSRPKAEPPIQKDYPTKLVKKLTGISGDPRRPTVTYGTLAYNPIFTKQSILKALYQDYPDALKTIMLLYQQPFPARLTHNLPIKITEIDVPGTWPGIWLIKLLYMVELAKSDIVILWDEDDMFEPGYTGKIIAKLQEGHRFCWSHNNIIVFREKVYYGEYRSPIGTVAGWTEPFREVLKEFVSRHPRGLNSRGNGPVDNVLRRELAKMEKPAMHDGVRAYFNHLGTNTRGDRDQKERIDYGFDWSRYQRLR